MIEPQRIIPSDTLYTMVTKMNAIIDTVVSIPGEVTDEIQRELNTKASIEYVDSQIALITADGIPKLASYYYTITSKSDGQTVFNIPLETFDKNTDTLLVFQNTTFIGKHNYTINDDKTFTLNTGVNQDTSIEILILKNVPVGPEGSINGNVLAVDSIPMDRIKDLLSTLGNINDETLPVELRGKALTEQIKQLKKDVNDHQAEKVQHLSYAIATGTNSYAVNIPGITALVEGMSVKINFTSANTGTSTLNINGLGAKPIQKSNGNDLSANNIKAGQIAHLVYTGSVFQLLGEGGEYGTAQAQDVLEGKTIGTEDGIVTGTMPNNGKISRTITTQGGQIVIPKGYHDGSGIVKAQFANLIASNIKKGVNVGGVVGSYNPTPTYQTISMSNVSYGKSWKSSFLSKIPKIFVASITHDYNDYYKTYAQGCIYAVFDSSGAVIAENDKIAGGGGRKQYEEYYERSIYFTISYSAGYINVSTSGEGIYLNSALIVY